MRDAGTIFEGGGDAEDGGRAFDSGGGADVKGGAALSNGLDRPFPFVSEFVSSRPTLFTLQRSVGGIGVGSP